MRRVGGVAALAFSLLGVAQCEKGEELAFGRAGTVVPIVLATRTIVGPAKDLCLTVIVYSNGLAQISRGEAENEASRSVQVSEEDVRALYAALGDAGAGELGGMLEDYGAIASRSRNTIVSYFQPSVIPGRAWSTTFSFASSPVDPRAYEIWGLLQSFVEQHFGRVVFEE